MPYKDILVHVDHSPQSAVRIEIAASLARQHGARLTGLYVVSHHFGKPRYSPEGINIKTLQDNFQRIAREAEIDHEWAVGDWTVSYESVAAVINHYACVKDLTILGQSIRGPQGNHLPADLPESVVFGSGRPVLIVPYAGNFPSVGKRVMVCWRHGREAARALAGAMPFLRKAKHVHILSVNPPGVVPKNSEVEKEIQVILVDHLKQHGISSKMGPAVISEIPTGDTLLNESWENGCDLLVLGAYMQTSQGPIKAGPVAKYILHHMTLPVLMAH